MKGALGMAVAAARLIGLDHGAQPGYSVDHRERRIPKPADTKKAAKRKAQRRARAITRRKR